MQKLLLFLLGCILCNLNLLSAAAAPKSPLEIPIHDLVQKPLISQVTISPDGTHVAALLNVNDRLRVLVKDLSSQKADPVAVDVNNHDVKWIRWANNQRIIAGTFVEKGLWNDTYALVVMDKTGADMHYLLDGHRPGNVIDILPDEPANVLVEVWSGSPYPEVYKVSIYDARKATKVKSFRLNINHWVTDANGEVRIGLGRLPRKIVIDAKTPDDGWETIREVNLLEDPLFQPLAINKSNIAYVLSRHEYDKAALYEYDLATQTFGKMLLKHETVDIEGIHYSRLNDTLEYAAYSTDRLEPYFFDTQRYREEEIINQALPDTSNWVTSRSADEKRVIVSATHDTCPTSYYLFDREKIQLEFLGCAYPELSQIKFPETRNVSYQARDGMTIYGYLTLPLTFDGSPLPMVVLVHGGPYARVQAEFDPWVQFLANRGYIVFQPNFRGSTGYGALYEQSGYQQWGRDMQNDIVDGVRKLSENEFVDDTRICIMGASYGGYAALMGVAKNSDIFCCAVSLAGISDLNTLMKERGFSVINRILIDDNHSDRKANSPITYAADIDSPVLLVHGTDDEVVNYRHSKKMYAEMKKHNKNVKLVKLKDETHNLDKAENRILFYEAMEEFLSLYMGDT